MSLWLVVTIGVLIGFGMLYFGNRLLTLANEAIQASATLTNEKLDVIHILVNSNMTAAMQAELDETRSSLVLMKEILDLKKVNGVEPSPAALAAIKTKEGKIAEMQAALRDRLAAASTVRAVESAHDQALARP